MQGVTFYYQTRAQRRRERRLRIAKNAALLALYIAIGYGVFLGLVASVS